MLGYSGCYEASGKKGLTTLRCDYSTEVTETPLFRILEGRSSSDAPGTEAAASISPPLTHFPEFLLLSAKLTPKLQTMRHRKKIKVQYYENHYLLNLFTRKCCWVKVNTTWLALSSSLENSDCSLRLRASQVESQKTSLSKPRHQEGEKPSGRLETPESESRRATHSLKLQAQSSQ